MNETDDPDRCPRVFDTFRGPRRCVLEQFHREPCAPDAATIAWRVKLQNAGLPLTLLEDETDGI